MEITDDGRRRGDKKWQILPFWQSFWENLRRQQYDVVTFTGRSSSAAISPILRLDPSDNLYFPYEPVKQERSADEIDDSEKPRVSYKPIPGELNLWMLPDLLFLTNSQLSTYLRDVFACRHVETDITEIMADGNDTVEEMKYYRNIRPHLREYMEEQKIVFRQLKEILAIYKLAMCGRDLDALKEIARLSFLSVGSSSADSATIHFQNIPDKVKACLPGLLNYALNCLDDVADIDGSLGPVKAKIAFSLYCNLQLNQKWARDLCEKMAWSL